MYDKDVAAQLCQIRDIARSGDLPPTERLTQIVAVADKLLARKIGLGLCPVPLSDKLIEVVEQEFHVSLDVVGNGSTQIMVVPADEPISDLDRLKGFIEGWVKAHE